MTTITQNTDGQTRAVSVDPAKPLLYVLKSRTQIERPTFWLGMAQYGACKVIVGAQVVRFSVKPVGKVGAEQISTLEEPGTAEKPHPIQQAFIEEGTAQCGFRLSGVILTAKVVLDVNPKAGEGHSALAAVSWECNDMGRERCGVPL